MQTRRYVPLPVAMGASFGFRVRLGHAASGRISGIESFSSPGGIGFLSRQSAGCVTVFLGAWLRRVIRSRQSAAQFPQREFFGGYLPIRAVPAGCIPVFGRPKRGGPKAHFS